MSFFRFLDNALLSAIEFLGGPSNYYCRLETACNDHTLVADDGSLLSFIELHGSLEMMGEVEFDDAVQSIVSSCSGYLQHRGHALQVVLQRDPDTVSEEIDANFGLMKNTAQAMGMDIDGIIDSHSQALEKYSASEHCWIVVWTHPNALPPSTKSQARKISNKAKVPPATAQAMNLRYMDVLLNAHANFLNTCYAAFNRSGLWASRMDAHKALWWIRKAVDPEWTSRSWRPLLPGDRIPLREAEAGDHPITGALYPKIKNQVFPRAAVTDSETVLFGNFLHRPLTMEMAPQQPQPFAALYRELVKESFGWRISFHISGDGLHGSGLKTTLAQLFASTNSENKQLVEAVKDLRDLAQSDSVSIVRFEANFDTWVDRSKFKTEKDARDVLDIQANYFIASLQSWGNMEVREVVGDPLLPFSASLPGVAMKTPSAKAAAPFDEVLAMLPWARPASPWNQGSLLLRTLDGKLFPVAPLSKEQASWIEIGYGGLGSGKSFWINSTNFAYIFQPGLDQLPYLGIIDIGPSSSGLIRLLEHALPPEDRKFVASYKMVQSAEYATNPFDTPVGCRKPFDSQMSFLINLLCAMCTPEDKASPADGVAGLLRQCITRAYQDFGDKKAKVYQPNVDPFVDERLQLIELHLDEYTTWWEVVDAFFDAGMIHEATLAQRYAVPLLPEVQGYARDPGLRDIYDFIEASSNQPITDYVSRKLAEGYAQFPIFQRPTKFDLGEARIVSLDLNDVAPKGGTAQDRETAIMYLLAMQLVSGKFFYAPEDADRIEVPNNPEMTRRYQNHHRADIKKLRQLPKRLVADEFHRAARTGAVVDQISQRFETCTRESRKWLISIGLYSQKIEDMPKAITDLATTHFILGADSPAVQRQLVERYAFNSAGISALRQLRVPNESGATCLMQATVATGRSMHLVVNTQGPQQRWMYSTTREDMDVRDELYAQIGSMEALAVLVKNHPGGVKDYVAKKRQQFARQGIKKDAIQDTIEELIESSKSEG